MKCPEEDGPPPVLVHGAILSGIHAEQSTLFLLEGLWIEVEFEPRSLGSVPKSHFKVGGKRGTGEDSLSVLSLLLKQKELP